MHCFYFYFLQEIPYFTHLYWDVWVDWLTPHWYAFAVHKVTLESVCSCWLCLAVLDNFSECVLVRLWLGSHCKVMAQFPPQLSPRFPDNGPEGLLSPPSRRCLCGDSDSRLQQLEPQRAGICTKTMVSPTDVFSACFVLVDDLWTFLSVHIRFSLCSSRDSRWVYRYICEAVCFLSEGVECHCSDLRNKICLPFF